MAKKKQSLMQMNIAIGRIPLAEKVTFARHLSVMLTSGLVIDEALEIAVDSAKGKMKSILRKILRVVQSGRPLSEALAMHPKVFSDMVVQVTQVGEESGTLAENLTHIADQLDKERLLSQKIKGAMTYPIVVLVAAFFLAIAMSYYVLPQLIPLFKGLKVDLPITTRMVIWFSETVQTYGWQIAVGIITFGILFSWFVKQTFSHPLTHLVLLNMPILRNITRNNNLVRFALTLGTLLKSGLPIVDALEITERTVPNFYFHRALGAVRKQVQRGGGFGVHMAEHERLFPRLATSMIHVGEESGRLDETLIYLAGFYEQEVDSATKTLTTALEPILLLCIGVVVGILALSIITPIYEITGNIHR